MVVCMHNLLPNADDYKVNVFSETSIKVIEIDVEYLKKVLQEDQEKLKKFWNRFSYHILVSNLSKFEMIN